MKKRLLILENARTLFVLLFVLLFSGGTAFGQYQINGTGSGNTYTQNFDAFRGTSATIPTNWIASGSQNVTAGNRILTAGFGTPTVAVANGNNYYAGRASGSSSDYSILQKQGTSGSSTFTFNSVNKTGSTINGLVITWNVEQFAAGGRPTTVDFKYSINGGAYVTANITGTTLYTSSTGSSTTFSYVNSTPTAYSISIASLSVANNQTIDIQYSITNGTGSGTNAHVGIDDFTMYATASASAATTLADNTPAISAGTIDANTNNNILSSFTLAQAGSDATFAAIDVLIDGTYTKDDIKASGFKLYTNSTNTFVGATSLGSLSSTAVTSEDGDILSFTGLTQTLTSGDTRYFWITADISAGALSKNLQVLGFGNADITLSTGTKSGSTTASGLQTIKGAVTTVADNGTPVGLGSITQGTNKNILASFTLTQAGLATVLNEARFTTSGTYVAADINGNGFKLWYNTSDDSANATELASLPSTAAGVSGDLLEFTGLTQAMALGSTSYFWVTGNVSLSATAGHTVIVDDMIGEDFKVSVGSKGGTASASGTKTIIATAVPTITVSPGSITDFTSTCIGLESASQSYTLTGVNLTANVIVTAPTGFKLRKGVEAYASSTSVTPSSGNVSTTIDVVYIPTGAGASGSLTITNASTGATTKNVSVSGTGNGGVVSITNHPVHDITTTTAQAGGAVISSTCGATITARGVVWNTAGSPTLADSSVSSGSGTTTYTDAALTPLIPNTRYYFSAYATNSNGVTGYGASDQFTTISNPPTAAVANTATTVGFTASWTAPAGNGAGVFFGYQVKVYTDAAFTALVQTNNYVLETFKVLTGLSPATQYYYTVSFENPAGYSATANYSAGITTLAVPSTSSDIVVKSGYTYPQNIAYASYQATDIVNGANDIEIAKFTIRDGGATTDSDNLGTSLTRLDFNVTNGANIRRIAIYDGATEIAEQAGATNHSFTSLTGLVAADGGTKDFSIRVSFKTAVTDNQQIGITITATTTAAATGSGFATTSAGGASTSMTGDNNRIEVTADRLAFTTQPTNTGINVAMSAVVVAARDINANVDLDATGSVAITSTGTLTGSPVSVALSAGSASFNSLTHTVAGTGLTLNASLSGLTGATSDTFDVTAMASGTYRTLTAGTWPTSGTATWERFVSGTWTSATPGSSTTDLLIIRHTITSNGAFAAAGGVGTQIQVESGGIFNNGHSSTLKSLQVNSGGIFSVNVSSAGILATTGTLTVESGGKLMLNSSDLTGVSAIWNGVENFKSGSTVEVANWNYGASGNDKRLIQSTNKISLNADDYAFGNLTIGGAPSAIFVMTTASTTVSLCQNNFTVATTSGNNVCFSNAAANVTVGGNVIVNSGQLSFASTTNGYPIVNILGNLTATGGNINLNQGSSGAAQVTVNLSGDLQINATQTLFSTDSDSVLNFSGTGDGSDDSNTQTINVVNASTATNILFNVKSGAYAKLINQNFVLGSSSKLTVKLGGTLDFGFGGSTALNVTGTSFEAESGSTLKITSTAGIAASGATGNVQTTVPRTLSTGGNYHYIGKANQVTGSALPATVANLTIENGIIDNIPSTNDVTLTQAVKISGILALTSGNIVSSDTNLLELGTSTSVKGELAAPIAGFVKGPMKRWFEGPNLGVGTGLFPFGTVDNKNRFATIEYAVAPETSGAVTAKIIGTPMGTAGLLPVPPNVPLTGTCPSFTVLSTDDMYWKMTPSVLSGGIYSATLQKESTSTLATCKQTILKGSTASWGVFGTQVQPGGSEGNIILKRTGLTGVSDLGIGRGFCSNIVKTYASEADWDVPPTLVDKINVTASHIITSGAISACECEVAPGVVLTVNTGAALVVAEKITIGAGGFIDIKDSGSLVQVTDVPANENSGSIKMARQTPLMYRYDFTYWSSPVDQFPLKNVSQYTLFDKFFSWNEISQEWTQHLSTGAIVPMVAGKGYTVRAPQSFSVQGAAGASAQQHTANFSGLPNNGIISANVFGSGSDEKWNLLGNPYASAIGASAFLSNNTGVLGGTIYFWTHKSSPVPNANGQYFYTAPDYVAWNGSGSTADCIGCIAPLGKIAAGQSFFVKGVGDGVGTATFSNKMRVAGPNDQFYKSASEENPVTAEKHRVWLNLTGATKGFNQTLIGYVDGATNGLDTQFDGDSFGGNEVTFYSVLDTKKLVIQGRALPFTVQDSIPLGYKTTLTGNLTISIDHKDGLLENQVVYLKDNVLNVTHNLSTSNYVFASTPGTYDSRFVLKYVPQENLDNPTFTDQIKGVTIRKNNADLHVSSPYELIDIVSVYDITGRLVFEKKQCNSNTFTTSHIVGNDQTLIVKVQLVNGGVVTGKVY